MTNGKALFLVVILVAKAGAVAAQQAPSTAPVEAEPVLLTLPIGSQVRLQARTAPGQWMKGVLVSADAASVAFVPENAPPLGANQMRVPSAAISRFELKTGSKRHWLWGLAVGAALGLAVGATTEVYPESCDYMNSTEFCSRGEAIAYSTLGFGAIGAGVGALIKTDRWTPVALDALAPPAPRVSGMKPRLRVLPGGGVGLGIAFGF
jgi:hypothetical protein